MDKQQEAISRSMDIVGRDAVWKQMREIEKGLLGLNRLLPPNKRKRKLPTTWARNLFPRKRPKQRVPLRAVQSQCFPLRRGWQVLHRGEYA